MGLVICNLGFVLALLTARRSLTAGLGSVLTVGYLYGILRANFLDTYAPFLFDAPVLGFYLGVLLRPPPASVQARAAALRYWLLVLAGWTAVMFSLPLQHPLIQLVGLRGNAFLLPFLLVGGWLQGADAGRLSVWLAALNVLAVGFAVAEFVVGVPAFYPQNGVTELIYNSNDVAGYTALRIPATFANAHAYAGTMVSSIPWLVGALVQRGRRWWARGLLLVGIAAALLGVFFTATRVGIVLLCVLVLVTTVSGRLRGASWLGWIVMLAGVAYFVSAEERMQRFLTLFNTEEVLERVEGSVNLSFLELLSRYPMGNGLGAGGTSIPFFLQGLITNPVGLENEYSRILLEQGVVGLALWGAFIAWIFTRPTPPRGAPWWLGWRLLWYAAAGNFALAVLGTGLMTAIPMTVLLFLSLGFMATYLPAPSPSTTVAVGGRNTVRGPGDGCVGRTVLAH
jgi:hypothetical protein